MKRESVLRLIEALGVEHSTIKEQRGWANAPCPLAPYTHAGGSDTRPSFGISLNDREPSVYVCFGCSPTAKRLDWLLHSMFVASGKYPFKAAKIFAGTELYVTDDDEDFQVTDLWTRKAPEPVFPLRPKVFKKYPLLQNGTDFEARRCREWLSNERRIPIWVQNLCRLRYHYDSSSVVFPLTDVRGNIFLMRERSRKEKRIWTITPKLCGHPEEVFPKLSETGVWFNMMAIDWSLPVILVEGEIDCMRLISLGAFNAIASCTSSVTMAQIDSLTAETIILGFDSDSAGDHACRCVRDRLLGRVAMYRANWTLAEKSPGVEANDPGDLPDKKALNSVMSNLEEVK